MSFWVTGSRRRDEHAVLCVSYGDEWMGSRSDQDQRSSRVENVGLADRLREGAGVGQGRLKDPRPSDSYEMSRDREAGDM